MKKVLPGPGQESVWDYPRPPRVEVCEATRIQIQSADQTIVDTRAAVRVLETSHPPVYYVPIADLINTRLMESRHRTWCEWKGQAVYFSLVTSQQTIENAGWCYPNPNVGFEDLRGKIAFYPSKMSACYVDDQRVVAQEGDFYGGWITSRIVGPYKGGPGTRGW